MEIDTINAIVFPYMYEREDFEGSHANEDEVDNFNPNPKAKEGKPLVKEPFVQTLKYKDNIPNPPKAETKPSKPEIVLDDEGNPISSIGESAILEMLARAAAEEKAEKRKLIRQQKLN